MYVYVNVYCVNLINDVIIDLFKGCFSWRVPTFEQVRLAGRGAGGAFDRSLGGGHDRASGCVTALHGVLVFT
jgi:hypothetical protein